MLTEVTNAWSYASTPSICRLAYTGTILSLVWLIGHVCSKRLRDFRTRRRVSVPEGGHDSTMEHSAIQALFGPSLSLILTAGGGPSSPGGRRVRE